jgi:hypothetical protein
MSLIERLSDLVVRIGSEVKSKISADHPSVARAWVCFGYDGSTVTLRAAYNVANVTRTARGRYRVFFSKPMPDSHYCWTGMARSGTNKILQRLALAREGNDEKTEHYVDISCTTLVIRFSDPTEINLTVFR